MKRGRSAIGKEPRPLFVALRQDDEQKYAPAPIWGRFKTYTWNIN
jgi:hypothetical protein